MRFYGYRYYDPVTGRWPSRDPLTDKRFFQVYSRGKSESEIARLSENSRLAIYVLVNNDPPNGIDGVGLESQLPPGLGKFYGWQVGVGVAAGVGDYILYRKACDRLFDRVEQVPEAICGDGTYILAAFLKDRFAGILLNPLASIVYDSEHVRATKVWLDKCCKCKWSTGFYKKTYAGDEKAG